jgi:hypothetical protein
MQPVPGMGKTGAAVNVSPPPCKVGAAFRVSQIREALDNPLRVHTAYSVFHADFAIDEAFEGIPLKKAFPPLAQRQGVRVVRWVVVQPTRESL